MNNELLLLFKKHTDILIQQTQTRLEKTLEFAMSRQMQTFFFNPPINLVEECIWPSSVSSFSVTNSVFNITCQNERFSISIPGHWNSEDGEDFFNELKKLLELRSENDIELHVKEVEKRGTRIEIEKSFYNLAGFDRFKSEIFSELKE